MATPKQISTCFFIYSNPLSAQTYTGGQRNPERTLVFYCKAWTV